MPEEQEYNVVSKRLPADSKHGSMGIVLTFGFLAGLLERHKNLPTELQKVANC